MGWELTQVLLANIMKGVVFKISLTWQGKTRVGVGGGMLSK
jgi:hypothetical protein